MSVIDIAPGASDAVVDATAALHPDAPATLEQAGLGEDVIIQLVLKMLHFGADCSGLDIARRLGLEYTAVEPALHFLKRSHQCEVFGGSTIGGPSFRYRITEEGRRRALLCLEQSHYVGPAPVPLAQYYRYMDAYRRLMRRPISRGRVRDAYSHLVLNNKILDQIGPAIAAGHSMFIYGPPGNGKTVIAQAIANLLEGEIAIPYALEIEGQIIRVFDPVNHCRLDTTESELRLTIDPRRDARWVRCRRPVVTVGGELTLSALDLTYSPMLGFYTAPVQAIANGGALIIDDFGRQHCSPRDLLNRWIVPLESRVDYLTLHTGQKIHLPFMALVVFATNIRPTELVDEAFLRRIQYKVFAESPTRADFVQIFKNCCEERGLAYDPALVNRLLDEHFRPHGIALRGCHPRDLIEQALAHGEYLGEAGELTYSLLEAACASYFVDDTETAARGV